MLGENELTVRRFTSSVIIWVLLILVLVDVRAVLCLAKPPVGAAAQSSVEDLAFTRPDSKEGKLLAENAKSLSQEYRVKSERENKKPYLCVRRITNTSLNSEEQRFQPASDVPIAPLPLIFFHRKISPPSSPSDPFLS